jgi:hypothetical protein
MNSDIGLVGCLVDRIATRVGTVPWIPPRNTADLQHNSCHIERVPWEGSYAATT